MKSNNKSERCEVRSERYVKGFIKKNLSLRTFHFSLPHGFTLIELLVVIAMIAVLTALGIASYASYNGSQVVQTAASDVVNTLNTAKSQAISQVKPEECGDNSLNGYEVEIDSASQQYMLAALCKPVVAQPTDVFVSPTPTSNPSVSPTDGPSPTPTPSVPDKVIVVTKPLPPQVTFDQSSLPIVSFAVSTGTVATGGTITISGYGKTKTISINGTGQITQN